MVAINTAVGQTERVNIPEITAQGGTWGPLLCSNSIDTVGKILHVYLQMFLGDESLATQGTVSWIFQGLNI